MNGCKPHQRRPDAATPSSVADLIPLPDCNQNGAPDTSDIANAFSADCNQNMVPDECDVGFDPRITDVNHNLIPDECEPDVGAAAAAFRATVVDPSVVADLMTQWWNSFDYEGLKAWQMAYEIKMKFAELGFDLRATLEDGGTQP